MRLLLISSSAPYGHGESFVITEANALAEAGCTLTMIPTVLRPGDQTRLLDPRIRTQSAALMSWNVVRKAVTVALSSPVLTLRALLACLQTSPMNVAKNLSVFPKALWVAHVARQESVDAIHAHWASTPATVAMVAGIVTGIPWSFTAHRGDIVANNALCNKIRTAAFARAISQSGVKLANRHCPHDADRLRVLHLGVQVPDTPTTPSRKRPSVILCPANLNAIKGHRYLIEAVARIDSRQDLQLWIAGDGPLKTELQSLVRNKGVERRVTFLGMVPHDRLLEFYRQGEVSIVVLPSLDLGDGRHEGIPVSLMEAMAHRVPVISTKTGGIPELLDDGCGVLVGPADSSALADAILNLLSSGDLCRRVSQNGHERVKLHYDLAGNAKRLLDWLHSPAR